MAKNCPDISTKSLPQAQQVHVRITQSDLGLAKRQGRNLSRYLSLSVMIGSRRVWERRRFRVEVAKM